MQVSSKHLNFEANFPPDLAEKIWRRRKEDSSCRTNSLNILAPQFMREVACAGEQRRPPAMERQPPAAESYFLQQKDGLLQQKVISCSRKTASCSRKSFPATENHFLQQKVASCSRKTASCLKKLVALSAHSCSRNSPEKGNAMSSFLDQNSMEILVSIANYLLTVGWLANVSKMNNMGDYIICGEFDMICIIVLSILT